MLYTYNMTHGLALKRKWSKRLSILWTVVYLLLLSPSGFSQNQCIELFSKSADKKINVIARGFLTAQARLTEILQKVSGKKTYLSYKVPLTEEMSQELRNAQAVFLRIQSAKQRDHSGRPIPKQFNLHGEIFQVVSVLGVGGEGEVFLVHLMEQTYVIKKFHDPKEIQENLDLTIELKRKGVNIILPLGIDSAQGLVLFPYVDGLDLHEIFKPDRPFARRLPISHSTVDYIKNAYSLYAKEHDLPAAAVTQNIVLDLQKNEFIIIDAQ
jgi:hypothetical protein